MVKSSQQVRVISIVCECGSVRLKGRCPNPHVALYQMLAHQMRIVARERESRMSMRNLCLEFLWLSGPRERERQRNRDSKRELEKEILRREGQRGRDKETRPRCRREIHRRMHGVRGGEGEINSC